MEERVSTLLLLMLALLVVAWRCWHGVEGGVVEHWRGGGRPRTQG